MALYNCAGGNGGGGGGTSDYEQLSNLPQVNNNILIGNKSASDLGLVGAVAGKGLSTNDYTNTDKAIVDGVTSALAGKVDTSLVGSANGIAELDSNGKVPSSQLPSYVDDVLEYADLAHFPATGETGKIYIAEDTNKTYRWSGSDYAEISESLALGETSSTAYAGNKGKANADAIAGIKNGTSINSFGDVETALAGKANTSAIPTKTSQLTNDSGFITNSVSNLSNYYTKSNTYTKTEVDSKVGSLKIKFTQLLSENNVPTTYRSYSCNWNDYDILMIIVAQFGNWTASVFIDKAYFSTTGTGTRPIIKEVVTGVLFEIYNNGTNAVMIKASSVSDKARVMIEGVTISL